MARDSRRRRRTRIAAGTCTGDGEPPTRTSIHDLPDDLLEQVLLRVRTPVCLFRAAATCKLWRRVIAGDYSFLHRVRSHHHRLNHLLGYYSVNTTKPGFCRTVAEFVPFPARPAVHLRQRLSLDFLVDGEDMLTSPVLTDSRDGLLAFVDDNWSSIVCDPWTRQYMVLDFPWGRPVEDEDPGDRDIWYDCLGAFILDAGDGDGEDKRSLMSSFSVLCVCLITDLMDDTTTAEASAFSARDNGWIRSTVSSDVYTGVEIMDMNQRFVGRAAGSIFFSGIEIDDGHVLLVLDEATADFSTITLPLLPNDVYDLFVDRENLRVVDGGPGTTLVRIVRLVEDDLEVLKVTRALHGGWECMVERSVGLCQLANIEFWPNRSWRFLDTTTTAAATLVLGAFSPASSTLLFSLDVQTMKMKLQRANKKAITLNTKRVFPYELPLPQTIN